MTIGDNKVLQRDNHNYYIDLFRFFLISWIVLFHYTIQYNSIVPDRSICLPVTFENGGALGVSLFFMVSGYFMTKSLMTENYGLKEYFRYIAKRYLRLWFPYVFACIIIYIWIFFLPVAGRTVDFTTLIANIACIIHPGFDRVDNAHWFLADLLTVQLLLGLLLLFHNIRHRGIIVNIVFIIVMLGQIYPFPILSGFSKELFEVLLGIQLFQMRKDKSTKNIVLSSVGFLVLLYTSVELFVFAVVFLSLTWMGKIIPLPPSSKQLKYALQFTGSISFYWYLVHQNIGYSIMYYYVPLGTTNEFWLLLPITITLLISVIVYLIDKKISKLIYGRIRFLKH